MEAELGFFLLILVGVASTLYGIIALDEARHE